MDIAVVVRQVPDLIEPLPIQESGVELDWDEVTFLANEADEHALEQAILIKERGEADVTVVALDHGEVDNTLYSALAKGAERVLKIPWDEDAPPSDQCAAAMYVEALRVLDADLVLIGCWAHDELHGALGPRIAEALQQPYLGVVRGVELCDDSSRIRAYKEYPGAVKAAMSVHLPAVLGILAADQPPRYVAVTRIRAAMKSGGIDEQEIAPAETTSQTSIARLYYPDKGDHAEIIDGSEEEIAERLVQLLESRGLVK